MKSKFPGNVTNHRFALEIEIQSGVYNPLSSVSILRLLVRTRFRRVKLHLQRLSLQQVLRRARFEKFKHARDLNLRSQDVRDFRQNLRERITSVQRVLSLNYRLPEGADRWNHGIGSPYQRQGRWNRRARSLILAALNIA